PPAPDPYGREAEEWRLAIATGRPPGAGPPEAHRQQPHLLAIQRSTTNTRAHTDPDSCYDACGLPGRPAATSPPCTHRRICSVLSCRPGLEREGAREVRTLERGAMMTEEMILVEFEGRLVLRALYDAIDERRCAQGMSWTEVTQAINGYKTEGHPVATSTIT